MLVSFRVLLEKDVTYAPIPPSAFKVEYYVVTPKGTRGRFTTRTSLSQIRGAKSETAVLAYLKQKHPTCSIEIMQLDWVK